MGEPALVGRRWWRCRQLQSQARRVGVERNMQWCRCKTEKGVDCVQKRGSQLEQFGCKCFVCLFSVISQTHDGARAALVGARSNIFGASGWVSRMVSSLVVALFSLSRERDGQERARKRERESFCPIGRHIGSSCSIWPSLRRSSPKSSLQMPPLFQWVESRRDRALNRSCVELSKQPH